MWKPRPLATLGASMAYNRDIFTFTINNRLNSLHYEASIIGQSVNNELERMWKEMSWYNLKYYLGICQDGLKKTTTNRSNNRWSESWDMKLWHNEAGGLTSWLWCLVIFKRKSNNTVTKLGVMNLQWYNMKWTTHCVV
jgi:hypothetical protein